MKDDTIKRKDAIGAINGWLKLNHFPEFGDGILYLVPSADNEIIGKLKTAIENEEICKKCPTAERITGENLLGAMALGFSYGMEADRPQGEWINKGAVCQCTRCKGYSRGLLEEENGKLCEPHRLIYPWFCPNCGAKMKGADDE